MVALPTVRLTASVSAFSGAPPVAVSCYFSASRPLEQAAHSAFNAALPAPADPADAAGLRERELRLQDALVDLFDASCLRVTVRAQGDMEDREATVADVARPVKVAMAMKLCGELDARINEPGQ